MIKSALCNQKAFDKLFLFTVTPSTTTTTTTTTTPRTSISLVTEVVTELVTKTEIYTKVNIWNLKGLCVKILRMIYFPDPYSKLMIKFCKTTVH